MYLADFFPAVPSIFEFSAIDLVAWWQVSL